MRKRSTFCAMLLMFSVLTTQAADPSSVPEMKKTQLALYLTAVEAFQLVTADPAGTLFLDVRTKSEIEFLGMPKPADANIPYMEQSEWREWDDKKQNFKMEVNQDFAAEVARRLAEKNLTKDDTVILICRSGDRSAKGADLLAQLGFKKVFSVIDGYEGDLANEGAKKDQRIVNGWKNANLPWTYKLERKKMYKIGD